MISLFMGFGDFFFSICINFFFPVWMDVLGFLRIAGYMSTNVTSSFLFSFPHLSVLGKRVYHFIA